MSIAGDTGAARVVDSRNAKTLTTYQLTPATGHFINDITLPLPGDWVQTSKRISNPYMGKEMLDCGKVERKVEPGHPRK